MKRIDPEWVLIYLAVIWIGAWCWVWIAMALTALTIFPIAP